MTILSKAFKAYKNALQRHPIGVQAVQTGMLLGLGDIIAQTVIEKKSFENINKRRLVGYSALGFCVLGPSLRIWFGVLDRMFPSVSKKLQYKKVIVDQLTFAPTIHAVMFCLTNAVTGHNVREIQVKFRQNYVDILIASYKLWPAVMIVNFSLVPLQYQVLVVQVVALLWNTYFSWKANQPIKQPLTESIPNNSS